MRHFSLLITSFFLTLTTVILPAGCATAPSRVGNADASDASKNTASKDEQIAHFFEVLDVNGDGKLSKNEAQSGFKYLIASYDRGGKTEILAAKPGADSRTGKAKSKRRPTSQDATRAFEALFVKDGGATDTISKDEFKKLVVKASDNPETDPFGAFYE
ncbi:MAG: hypothetical protein JNJ49_11595 [Bdellovibrionaceae bacterium]|nr:hypothetical protein [Pseudobdellovibrionaceae bacterium]